MNIEKLIYSTSVDISKPNGPGVNEREFVGALARRFNDQVTFVVRRPQDDSVLGGLKNVQLFGGDYGPVSLVVNGMLQERVLGRCVERLQPDIVVLRAGQFSFGLALSRRWRSGPYVLKTQGDPWITFLCEQPGIRGHLARLLRKPNAWAHRRMVEAALAVDSCTPQLLDLNQRLIPRMSDISAAPKMIVVENGTDTSRFVPLSAIDCRHALGIPEDAAVVGYVGGRPHERGGRQVIQAVAALAEEIPQMHGVVVGGRPDEVSVLQNFARGEGVQSICTIPGAVPYADVVRWINTFDVGIGLDTPHRLQSIGSSNQKIRQYLACGKPVIAGKGTNTFLEAEDLGSLVDQEHSADVVDAVRRWLRRMRSEENSDVSRRAISYAAKEFSVDSLLECRLTHWETCLRGERSTHI